MFMQVITQALATKLAAAKPKAVLHDVVRNRFYLALTEPITAELLFALVNKAGLADYMTHIGEDKWTIAGKVTVSTLSRACEMVLGQAATAEAEGLSFSASLKSACSEPYTKLYFPNGQPMR